MSFETFPLKKKDIFPEPKLSILQYGRDFFEIWVLFCPCLTWVHPKAISRNCKGSSVRSFFRRWSQEAAASVSGFLRETEPVEGVCGERQRQVSRNWLIWWRRPASLKCSQGRAEDVAQVHSLTGDKISSSSGVVSLWLKNFIWSDETHPDDGGRAASLKV